MLLFQVANPDVNLTLILPELIVAIAGVIVMIVDAFSRPRQRLVTGTLISAVSAGGRRRYDLVVGCAPGRDQRI